MACLPTLWRPTGSDKASAGVEEGRGGTGAEDEVFVAIQSLLMVTAIAVHAGESAGAFPKACSTNLFLDQLIDQVVRGPGVEAVVV
jgi:hypothetical protein